MNGINEIRVSFIKVTRITDNNIGRINVNLGNGISLNTSLVFPQNFKFINIDNEQMYAILRKGMKKLVEEQSQMLLVTKDDVHNNVVKVLQGKLAPFDYVIGDIRLDNGTMMSDYYVKIGRLVKL